MYSVKKLTVSVFSNSFVSIYYCSHERAEKVSKEEQTILYVPINMCCHVC